MTRIIFVRHGQSPGNSESTFYGQVDKGLTELGKKQAEFTAKFLKDWKIDTAYSSDLGRALDTGKAIVAYHSGLEIIPEEGLREIYAGDWENKKFSVIAEKYSEEYKVWFDDLYNACPTNGESIKHMCKRVSDTVWKIAEDNKGKTVLITTHATPIRILNCSWLSLPFEMLKDISWVRNASVSVVDYDTDNKKTEIEFIDKVSFQGEFSTSLPKNI